MNRIYTNPLPDDDLRAELESGDTICFMGRIRWQEVERQVERLGFGDVYMVSCTEGPHNVTSKVILRPQSPGG